MARLAFIVTVLAFAGCDGMSNTAGGNRARLNRIAATYQQGDFTSVIVQMEDYLRDYPGDDLAWTIFGNAYEKLDHLDDAQSAYESALAINPRNVSAITGLGILDRRRGDYDAAIDNYRRAIEIDSTYAEAYTSIAAIALASHKDRRALEYAVKAYELDQSNPAIAANLAIAYHYNSDMENRDKFTRIAEQLGYDKLDRLQQVYSGELTVRD